jgi:hypothetical protein
MFFYPLFSAFFLSVFLVLLSQCSDQSTPSPGGKYSTGPCPMGNGWLTVDNFQFGSSSIARDLASDSSGGLYVAGTAVDTAGNSHWLVRRSKDGAKTWTTSDDFRYPGGSLSAAVGITVDPSNNVFVVGSALDSQLVNHWIIRQGVSQATSWSTVKDFVYPGATDSKAGAVAVDLLSNVYVTGTALNHMVTLQSTNLGGTWQIIDDYNPGSAVQNFSVGVDLAQTVFTVGSQSTNPSRWIVRSGVFTNSSWVFSTVDNYTSGANSQNFAVGYGVDSSNNEFVLGTTSATSGSQWLVRKSMNGGASWNGLSTFPVASETSAFGGGFTQDGLGGVYAAVQTIDAQGNYHSKVIASLNSGTTWTFLDDFLASASGATAPHLRADNSGKVYAVFGAQGTDGFYRWTVRTCL